MDVTNIERVDVEKVAEEFPQSRFRITNEPVLNPGICVVCGSSGGDGRQFADFGKTQDWFGVFYLCTFCLAEVAKMMGFATYGNYNKLFGQYEKALLNYGNANLEIERLQEQVNAARILLRNCHCDNSDLISNDNIPDAVVVEDSEGSEGSSDDDSESSGVEESGDFSEASVDDEGNKPKRTRRGSANS